MKATEKQWLRWFYFNTDFGPAHENVVNLMQRRFKQETGLEMPDGWEDEE